jgi:peptidoglycan/LPS O-acetylase OafA/YrhL
MLPFTEQQPTATGICDNLSRITSSGRVIPEVDGLRFIAISSVVLYHLSISVATGFAANPLPPEHAWYSHLVRHGHYGVQLFFVLSGFILALPFAAHHLKGTAPLDLKRYYLRRVTRLVPPFVFTMVGFYCMMVWFQGRSASELFSPFVCSLIYVHGLTFGSQSMINPVSWSLEIEVQFYLIVPLLTQLFAIREKFLRRSVITALGLLFMLCQFWFIPERGPLSFTLASHLQYFLVGFLVADVYVAEWNEAPVSQHSWDCLWLIGWPFLLWIGERPGLTQLLLPLMLFCLLIATFRSRLASRLLSIPLVTTVGAMCYTIYLLHWHLIPLVGKSTRALIYLDSFSVDLTVQLLIIGPVLLVVSLLFYALIERPCMRAHWPVKAAVSVRHDVSRVQIRSYTSPNDVPVTKP